MSWLAKYSTSVASSVLVLLLLSYSVFEVYTKTQSQPNIQQQISESLDEGVEFFRRVSEDFTHNTDLIYNDVNDAIQTGADKMALHNRLQSYDIWGVTVFHEGDKWIWSGFDVSSPSDSTISKTLSDTTAIVNFNNVVAILSLKNLLFNDEKYTILVADDIYKVSELPFSENRRIQISRETDLQINYPVYFNFFGKTPQGSLQKTLQTNFSDSVGTVYANPNEVINLQNRNRAHSDKIRFAFHIAIVVFFFFSLFLFTSRAKTATLPSFTFIIIAVLWGLIVYGGLANYWTSMISEVMVDLDIRSVREFTLYATNGFFILFLFISFHNLLRVTQIPEWTNKLSRSFILSSLLGAIQVILILFFIQSTQTLLEVAEIPLLDLELAPNSRSFFFYIFTVLFFTGISGFIVSAGYHLQLIESGKTALIHIITTFSFFCTFFLMDLILVDFSVIYQEFILSIFLLFIYLVCIHFLYKYPDTVIQMSGFRKLMITVFIASSIIYAIIWNAANHRLDQSLLNRASNFIEEESIQTDDVLFELLSELELNFPNVTDEDVNQRFSNIQIQFQELIRQTIRPDWQNYSFYIKLINERDMEIASFSTSIETPVWSTSFYNQDTMLRTYQGEQIRWHTNRPVIWDNLPLNLSERFVSLSRGWIPIYDSDNPREIIAWIAADVYLERADYNKPMRAVLTETPSEAWKNSFYIAEFTDGQLTRNAMIGLYNHQPQYHRLPEQEHKIAENDSISYLTNTTANGAFREVLLRTGNTTVVKASTPVPGLEQHLFSYFRLQIVLIFFGLFCFSILSMAGFRHFSPFGQSKRFRSRLIDGLAFATILFLIVLTFTTQYSVDIQNEKKLERELIQNLENLSELVRDLPTETAMGNSMISLADLNSPFNADVILYKGSSVVESTTPQVFQQNLLPSVLPFPVYDFIYNRQRSHYIMTTKIGSEELLVGYQSLLNPDGQPVAVIAIPTFLQSPIYNEQLLETTSYLFVVYLFIFILFIAGTVLLSGRLTKPLSNIQSGLRKISRGDMKTKVPVTSRDEIGSLANAYNNMVERLDEAQKELVKAERESAWKEMAQQVAHEIKNPLTPMKLNLQHLQRQLEKNPDKALDLKPIIEKTANNIIGQIESLNKIASDFSKFAQPIQEPKERIELTELIESVSDLYNHESAVKVDLILPNQKVEINAVKDELRRVLINLLKNSIEASEDEKACIQISLQTKEKHVILQIRDYGSGINTEDQEKVFVPKFSTKSSGTGLGLAISKKIIEAHGGDIWFESNTGEGTTFFVKLPLS